MPFRVTVSAPHPNPRGLPRSSRGSHTLMDRSSSPKATIILIGGRVRLDSWLSTVARMAFWGGNEGDGKGSAAEAEGLGLALRVSPQEGSLLTLKSSKSMW